jgi:exodeoxyribonuclease VII large subunit
MIKKITLLELNKSIQDTLKQEFSDSIWIVAEISELKVNRNGHCYLELIEKDLVNDSIIAKTRATIWAFTFRMLKPYFENTTGNPLTPGLKVLVQANIEFHELYGLSLNITDIDPNYTLGDLAQKKLKIINQLREDGIIDMNKDVEFPITPQKIAVISSETAAGYQDFVNQLLNNDHGYSYYLKLFPAIMQGLQAEESIISALEFIYKNEELFDIVVIIRGGGSQADLNCFDNYNIASNVAQFPLPILTGIGHDKDESILDIVSYKQLKTPTAVAEYILNTTNAFETYLELQKEKIESLSFDYFNNLQTKLSIAATNLSNLTKENLNKEYFELKLTQEKFNSKLNHSFRKRNIKISNYVNSLETRIKEIMRSKENDLTTHKMKLEHYTNVVIKKQNYVLENRENKANLLDPSTILRRGYSLTYKNNHLVRNINELNQKDLLITKLFNGFIRSKVESKNINNKDL